jgi:predicted ATPase/signal transduction histidine kinase
MGNFYMVNIHGIHLKREIYSSNHSRIFEGVQEDTGNLVIAKILQDAESKSQEKIRKFLLEYQILGKMNHPGIIKPIRMLDSKETPTLVLEHGGTSLRTLLLEKKFKINELLSISIQIAEILGVIHSHKIIHKDINPGNILYNSDTKKVKIIDFGISSILSRETELLKNPNFIEGTLAYISPEQTGRMNRLIDYRTDFYSLGITLYEFFTGSLPFRSKESMELIHQHLTTPFPPILEPLPELIIRIIQKLMSKNAEDRYQSAYGLKIDLENCLTFIQENKDTNEYEIGVRDISPELNIPEKLYGREKEVSEILEIFQRAGEGNAEIVVISGYSGAGKSALVRELYRPITKYCGYFLSGKFDQLQKDIPYSALVYAFRELVGQILTEPKERIQYWKESFLKALSPNAEVIIDVIPEFEEILGKQPKVPVLEPKEAQNRFNLYFEKFIHVLLKKEHPLVIFLDDLQWADGASLRFIQNLFQGRNIEHFLFLGAYRDNEVYGGHPSMVMLSELEKGSIKIHNFYLSPLSLENIINLFNDTFPNFDKQKMELINLIYMKTGGNPFFIRELLKLLYGEEKIRFLQGEGKWVCDLEKIADASITGNVIELMIKRLNKLSEASRIAIQFASCIGNEFDIQTLSIISKKSPQMIGKSLLEAIEAGFILSQNNNHKFLLLEEHASYMQVQYKFVHDRIQQAAYLLIPEEEKPEFHRQIGDIYLSRYSEEEIDTKIFDLLGHLNKAKELYQSDEEKYKLAVLNLQAGKRAKRSAAYEPSYNYLEIALEILGDNGWKSNYKLTYDIYLEIIESAYLSSQFSEMEKLVQIARLQSVDDSEKVKIMILEINGLMAQGKMNDVILKSIEAFKILGESYSENPSKIQLLKNYFYVKYLSTFYKYPLLSNKTVQDKRNLDILSLIYFIGSASSISNPNFSFYIVLKAVIIFFKYGKSKYSSMTIASYAYVISSFLNDVKSAKYFGELTESIPVNPNIKCRTDYVLNAVVKHWYLPLDDFTKKLYENYFHSLEYGDIEFASHSLSQYSSIQFIKGKNLIELKNDILSIYNSFYRLSQYPSIRWVNTYLQTILNLTEIKNPSILLNGDYFLENELIDIYKNDNDNSGIFNLYLMKTILMVVYNDDKELFKITEEMYKISSSFGSSILTAYFIFLSSFILLNLMIQNKISKTYLTRVKSNLKKLKYWSQFAPFNRVHQYLFIKAKILQLEEKHTEALELFDQSLENVNKNGFLMDEAIFYEDIGRYCLTIKKNNLAEFYLNKSWKAYQNWGAIRKISLLESEFSFLLKGINPFVTIATDISILAGTTSRDKESNIDLKTIVKFSQAISGEIEKEKILSKVIHLILQNAGASYACILLESGENLILEAKMRTGEEMILIQKILPDPSTDLPSSVVRYVYNRKENLLLNNAFREGNFTHDPYIQSQQLLSVLCVPLLNQGKSIGVLYLENNLIRGAFTADRIEILKLISSQAAISIENAKLYDILEEKVEARTNELLEQKKRMEKLQNFTTMIQNAGNFEEMLENIRLTFLDNFGLGTYLFYTCNFLSNKLELLKLVSYIPFPEDIESILFQNSISLQDETSIHVAVMKYGKSIFIKDAQKRKISKPETSNREVLGITSIYIIPLINSGKVFSVLSFADVSPNFQMKVNLLNLTKTQKEDIETLCQSISSGLYQSLQKKEIELQKKSIEELNIFIKSLNDSKDMNLIYEKIENYIERVYKLNKIAFGIVDETEKYAQFIRFPKFTNSSEKDDIIYGMKIPVVGIVGAHAFSFASSKPLYSKIIHVTRITPEERIIIELYKFKSFLILPLILDGKNIGFLDIGFTDSAVILTKEQLIQLSILAEHLSGIIYRTRLNSELQTQKLQLEKSLIQSDRMITLGTMVAGIAHEINTPLGAIKANGENIMESMSSLEDSINPLKTGITIETLQNVSYIFSISREPNTILSSKEQRTLRKKLVAYLEEHKYQNIDSLADKLIELGLVEALESGDTIFSSPGIGEALNLASLIRGIIKKAGVVQISAERVSKIVKSLKSFMHFEQTEEKKPADISEGMETVLVILHNKIKYGIEVIKNYGSLPQIPCYADELNQIWTNLIHNAIQAMGEKGILQIDIEKVPGLSAVPDIDKRNPNYTGEYISVSIQDSGSGISPEIRQKIFQAFFTTKPAGEGSGLGLHIIGKILEKHEGALYLESEPGRTRFSVLLPA